MLRELHLRNLGVVEEAALVVAPGLTVVTGETGAGKTVVLTAVALLAGARADTSLVRAGADDAHVEAVLTAPAGAQAWGVDPGDELIVSREVRAEGGSRARINGRLAPVGALAELLGSSIEVHAQHAHVRLGQPDVQRQLLDRHGGDPLDRVRRAYLDCWASHADAVRRLASAEADAMDRARELARLEHEVAEIDAASIDGAADAKLGERVAWLAQADEIRQAAQEAAMVLQDDDGAMDRVGLALEFVRRVRLDGDWSALGDRLLVVQEEIADVASSLRAQGDLADVDPEELDVLASRQALLHGLTRRYGPTLEDVVAWSRAASDRLLELRRVDDEAADLTVRVLALRAELDAASAALRDARERAGALLTDQVEGHLADLGMPHAQFRVDVEPLAEPGPDGGDAVSFLLAPNPGEPWVRVGRGVSGGEQSRVALAVEVALADVTDVDVMVFDEVDAGIGGATALAVGEKLARLARGRQVLCVTHLAQLAAFADVHHVVEKGLADGRTTTTVRRVDEEDRVVELSRMLGGDLAEVGREHARAMLDEATLRRAAS